jgi:hypothetical protein
MKLFLALFLFSQTCFSSGLTSLFSTPAFVSAGSSTTTSSTTPVQIFSRNTTAGKTYFISNAQLQGFYGAVSATGATIGTCSLEIPAGTTVATWYFHNQTIENIDQKLISFNPPLAAPTSVSGACTPAGST